MMDYLTETVSDIALPSELPPQSQFILIFNFSSFEIPMI